MKHWIIAAVAGGLCLAAASGNAWAQAGGAPTGVGDAQQLNKSSTVGATRGGTPDTGAAAPMSTSGAQAEPTEPAPAPKKKKRKKH